MSMKKQDIIADPSFQKYAKKKKITQKTMNGYVFSLLQFVNANERSFDQMVREILEDQFPFVDEDGRIHEYNVEYSKTDDYLLKTVDYLRSRGNSDHSIYAHLVRIRTILSSLNIQLPKMIELENDQKEWYSLSNDDIKYVMSISQLHHQALINFLAVTGIRIGDARNLTIADFMSATYKYHKCTEINDFLNKAPEGMTGFWQLIPQKTRKHKIECKVYNTPESSDLILKSLHRRRSAIQQLNDRKCTSFQLEKNDALFSSRNKNFKGKINDNTITTLFVRRNKEFQNHKKRLLSQDLENNLIGKETYDQLIKQIPVFHAHALRKFFITTLARKRVDLRASAYLEGHKPLMTHDRSYVDADNLDELIWNEYQRIIPALSFTRSEDDFEIEKRNEDLVVENLKLRDENEKLQQEKDQVKDDFKEEARKLLEDLLKQHNIKL